MRKIADRILTETGFRGCNCSCVVTPEGLVLIDTPYLPSDALKWRETLAEHGEVRYIINTENHVDHVLGNAFFEGVVISQEATRRDFAAAEEKLPGILGRIRELDPRGIRLMDGYTPKRPSMTFDHRLTLRIGNQVLELIHLPGHTPGQTAVYMAGERVVFTGDNVVRRTRPFYHECEPLAWIKSLEELRTMDIDVVVPGHGEICGRESVDEMISYNRDVFDQVRKAIGEGVGKEETPGRVVFADTMPLAEYQKEVGQVLERLGIHRIYEALSHASNEGNQGGGSLR